MSHGAHGIISILLLALVICACSREKPQPAAKQSQDATLELMGEPLFNERCRDCHKIGGKGGTTGPELSHIGADRDRAYLQQVIREPSKVFPGTAMPPNDALSIKQVNSLVDYLSSLK